MTLLEKGRVLARAWSMQLAVLGAALYALLLAIDPVALQAGWQSLPPELRAILPDQVRTWITMALFIAVAIARLAPQPRVEQRLGLLAAPIAAPPAWLTAARAPIARAITSIAVHCAATPEGKRFTAADIRSWHKAEGWSDIGYHFVILLDGTIEVGRPLAIAGAHVAGYNARSVGICYIGGVSADGKQTPKDTRTPAQKAALLQLLGELKARWPAAEIKGHRDYLNVAKACPSFDARREYADLGK